MANAIALNSVVAGQIKNGEMIEYNVGIPVAGKYVVELGGGAAVQFGIWQGSVLPANGKLRVCGKNARGCRMLVFGDHVIQVTGKADGDFTFKVRPWSFFDYFTINFYKSTC